jgi:hypothetical protein
MKTAAIALTVVLALAGGTAWSQPPQMIAYQGLITDNTGAPVADGTYSLTFRIYDAEVGGAELWSETQPSVAVSGGLFGVFLGSVTPLTLGFDVPCWLEVQVESETPQAPRIRLTNVPYSYTAMNADHVDGYDADATPTANTLLPLDASGQFPESAIPGGAGGGDITSVWPADTTLAGGADSGAVTLAVANPLHMTGPSDGVIVGSNSGGNYGYLGGQIDGVYGRSSSAGGSGVAGVNTGEGHGVYGSNQLGGNYGSLGGQIDGVYGRSSSAGGSGVAGVNTGEGHGVYGKNQSSSTETKAGVWGANDTGGVAVRGYKTGGYGVAVRGTNYGTSGSGTSGISTNWFGVWAESDSSYAVHALTHRADNNYGLYTEDNLYSLNFHTAGAVMHLARNGGVDFVEPGDVVVFSGAGAPLESGGPPVTEVSRAPSANSGAVAGIVYSRFNAEAVSGEPKQETGQGSKAHLDVTPGGAVSPGEYLLLVVQGPAQVKTSALSGAIRPGDLLSSASEAGYAAKAAEVTVGSVKTAVPGTVVAKALEPLDGGQGLIYAFVTLQ